jgi:hypothetical protein
MSVQRQEEEAKWGLEVTTSTTQALTSYGRPWRTDGSATQTGNSHKKRYCSTLYIVHTSSIQWCYSTVRSTEERRPGRFKYIYFVLEYIYLFTNIGYLNCYSTSTRVLCTGSSYVDEAMGCTIVHTHYTCS